MTTTESGFYVRDEISGMRSDWQTRTGAMAEAKRLRDGGCRRLMVCRPSGRIVAAWDDGERTI